MNKLIKNPFTDMQKVAMIVLCIVLAGILSSCTSKSEEVDEIVTDPETAILGKWELVYTQLLDVKELNTPQGYVEYLPDGSFAWYDNATKVYTVFEEKYWIDDRYGWSYPPSSFLVEDGMVLHYETSLIEVDNGSTFTVGPDFPDKPFGPHGNLFHLTFKNRNTMCLYSLDKMSIAGTVYFIFKRKN